ncbi:MAG: dihydrodipicolinate synthase family protein [Phycisphaerae bacterium]|nr:dihydrodipicolinate synthase family protein [Phycisphaerae bacterium]
MSPIISRERLMRIVGLHPGAVQVILPDWFVPTFQEIVIFLQGMAKASQGIGMILYNPPHAKKKLLPQEFAQLKQVISELIGLKVCDGDEFWYQQMREHCHNLSVFIPGHHLATGIKNGAQGSYSNMACLHPGAAQKWYQQTQDNIIDALELENRIAIFMQKYITPFLQQGYSNQALDKLLAAIGNWSAVGTQLRWPYKFINQDQACHIRQGAIDIIPEFIV